MMHGHLLGVDQCKAKRLNHDLLVDGKGKNLLRYKGSLKLQDILSFVWKQKTSFTRQLITSHYF